jgi:hypothetical protein
VYSTEKEATVQVTRLTEKRDAVYHLSALEPPPTSYSGYADIRFRVEAPAEFRGREIVLPICDGMEGSLFEQSVFTIRIPACFLEGKRSSEVKMPDGTIQVTTTDGLSFEGIVVNQANQALVPTPASVTPAAGAPVAPDAGAAHL